MGVRALEILTTHEEARVSVSDNACRIWGWWALPLVVCRVEHQMSIAVPKPYPVHLISLSRLLDFNEAENVSVEPK